MDSPNISNDQKLIISGDSEQGNGSVYTHIISDLTEKIESLQSEWQKLKSAKSFANMSSVQSDLNKIKAGMKVIDSAIQSTKDLIKNSDKKNSEASNQIRALKEEIERRFSVITKASDDDRSVGDKDLAKLKNEIVLICSKGMGQLNDRMEPIRNDVKNLEEALRKEKEKIQALTQSTNSIKNQSKSNEKKQAKIENSIKQFSSEIVYLRAELVSEQQKNVILENRVLTLESKFAEILLRNDVCLKSNENRCYETTNTTLISKKTSLEEPTFARNTCEFTSLVPPNKVKSPQLIDMELIEFETYFEETDNNSKELQDQTFNAVTKSEYHSNQTSHVYSGPEDVRHDLLQKVKDFPEKKLSIFSDNTKSDEPVDLSLSSGAGKKETLSYLEKAHEYLQSLQLEGIFAVTNEENISNSQSQKTEERGLCDFNCFHFALTSTVQKAKLSIKDFLSKCEKSVENCGLLTFTEEMLKEKLHFSCSVD